jgi:DNA-binding NarL/FixJ family response regulator
VEGDVIRLGIIDDHPLVREGTAALLREQPDIEVVAVAGDPDTAVLLLADESLDVVLLDIRLGSASGLHLLSAERRSPKPAIVVLTAYDYPKYAEAALRLGAIGYVLKSSPFSELLTAIRKAAAGEFAFGVRPSAHVRLTPRETTIVSLVVDGRSNDEIGGQLGISARTVETHLRHLFERLAVGSRTELTSRALREGWLDVPP